jgi:hypothetical protein
MEGAKTGENTRTRFWPKPSQRLANQRATITIPALWDGCDLILMGPKERGWVGFFDAVMVNICISDSF